MGNGEFGEVYEGTWNKQLKVAIKYRLATMDRDAFINEAKIMHKLHHDRLVQLMGVCTHPVDQPLMIITELMAKGSLLNFLKSDEGQNLTTKDHVLMITQVSLFDTVSLRSPPQRDSITISKTHGEYFQKILRSLVELP